MSEHSSKKLLNSAILSHQNLNYRFLQRITEKESNELNMHNIPDLIMRIHPKISNLEYKNLKNKTSFLEKNLSVCQSCYLDLIEYKTESNSSKKVYETVRNSLHIHHESNDFLLKIKEKIKKPLNEAKRLFKDFAKLDCSKTHQRFFSLDDEKKNSLNAEEIKLSNILRQQMNTKNEIPMRKLISFDKTQNLIQTTKKMRELILMKPQQKKLNFSEFNTSFSSFEKVKRLSNHFFSKNSQDSLSTIYT